MIDYNNYDLDKEVDKILKTKYSCKGFFNWYGYKKIICELYNIKSSKCLSARVFHSIFPTEYELYLKDSILTPEIVLCNRLSQVDYLISKGRNSDNTFAVGGLFPFYRRLKKIEKCENAKGTIAFPIHTSKQCEISLSYQDYIDALKKLPEEFQPVHVCLHWRDIEKGLHKIFLENGINVYCAGHCNDEDFCDNFYEICRHFKYATCNSIISTSLLYAAEMGVIPFYYSNENEAEMQNALPEVYGMTQEEYDNYMEEHYKFFEKVIPRYPDVQMENESLLLIEKIMGLDKQSPKELVKNALLKRKRINKIKMITNLFFKDCSNWQKYKYRILGLITISIDRKL